MFKAHGDIGTMRQQPTPSSEILIGNADNFIKRWRNKRFEDSVILNDVAINEVEKLKVHML